MASVSWHSVHLHHSLARAAQHRIDSSDALSAVISGGDRVALRSGDGRIDYAQAFESLNVPLLVIAGDADDLAPPASVRPAYEHSRSLDKTFRVFNLGHVDLVLGREAVTTVWPLIGQWLERRFT